MSLAKSPSLKHLSYAALTSRNAVAHTPPRLIEPDTLCVKHKIWYVVPLPGLNPPENEGNQLSRSALFINRSDKTSSITLHTTMSKLIGLESDSWHALLLLGIGTISANFQR